ncbi:phosphoglucosamine mutase, partial [Halorubrum tibetense]
AFGGEPSGAWIFPEETLCPDGPLAAVRLAALVATEPLSTRLSRIDRYPIRRTAIRVDAKAAVMERVETAVGDAYDEVSTLDGLRVDTDDGWFLIRPSGTESLVRVTAEARAETAADALFDRAVGIVEDAVGLVESAVGGDEGNDTDAGSSGA